MDYVDEIKSAVDEQRDAIVTIKGDLETRLKALEAKSNRPGMAIDASFSSADTEHKGAFLDFLQSGNDANLKAIEAKALSAGVNVDGGFGVPKIIDSQIAALLRNTGGLRQVARVMTVGAGYRKLISTHGAATGWVSETAARPATNTPQLQELIPSWGEIYANPQATQVMLDDVFFDAGAWLAEELAEEFSLAENGAFITGDGTNKPRGILNYTFAAVTDATRVFGQFEKVKTGVSGGFVASAATTSPIDTLVTVVHRLAAPYRANASWIMNANTLEVVRKWKFPDGTFVWQPATEQGQPSMLLGYPVYEVTDMPDIGAAAIPILFGDFQRGYYITEREMGTRILRDPFTNKPYVGFYTTKRIGGMAVDTKAIKGISLEV